MSHTTTLKGVQIKSASAIRKAVDDLIKSGIDMKLLENTKPRMYYSSQSNEIGNCEFVLRLNQSSYDVGLKWNEKEKQYDAYLDTWAGQVSGQIGATCAMPRGTDQQGEHAIGKFTQRYGLHAAKDAARAEGYDVIGETIDDDGTIHLELAV